MATAFAILAGLPGGGKSTLARRLKTRNGIHVVSSDALRLALNAGVYPRDQGGEYGVLDPIVWTLAERAITTLLRSGLSAGIDATNLTSQRRRRWRDLARTVVPHIPVTIHWCGGDWDSPQRWGERGYTLEGWRAVRLRLEAAVELPTADEADEVRWWYGSGAGKAVTTAER